MFRVLLSLVGLVLCLILHFSSEALAQRKERPKPTAGPTPALKGAGSVDLEDLLSKNPFPADSKGPLHFAPIFFAKPPKSRVEYTLGGLHSRGDLPMHKHKLRTEIIYVLAGTGSFFLGGETIALKPGLVLHVPVGTPHGFKLDGDGRVLFVSVGKFNPKDHFLVADKPEPTGRKSRKSHRPGRSSGGRSPGGKSIGGGGGPSDVVTPSTRD